MQPKLLVVGAALVVLLGGAAAEASGRNTVTGTDQLQTVAAGCSDTAAERAALLQPVATLSPSHRSGLAAAR